MGITTKLVNTSAHAREVELVLANGTIDTINIMPSARVTPPPGSKINPAKEKSYISSFLTVLTLPDGKSADTGPMTADESAAT
jgi:hypothetical protein